MKVRPRSSAVVILGGILIIGAVLRFHNLEYRTLNHPEVYAPGIDLPWHLSNPHPRFTLQQTLAGSIAGEPHPPGYYIVMLGWTKWFGSSLLALRLPSVLFGVASILLIYVLARYTEDRLTALLAAAMLALNGLHLYQSQTARMYAMACFLGLWSTVLLVLTATATGRQLTYRVLYVTVTVAGLATHVYVWPLFIAQGVWVLATSVLPRRSLVHLLRLQIFTFIVATPLVAIAVFQRGAASAPPTLTPLEGVLRFWQSGSLFEITPLAVSKASVAAGAALVAVLATALLFASAVLRKSDGDATDRLLMNDGRGYRSPHPAVTAVVGVLMVMSILVFVHVANTLLPNRSTRLVVASSLLPVALVVVDVIVRAYWGRLTGLRAALAGRQWPGRLRSLIVVLAVLPVGIVAVISAFTPVLVQRGTLIFVPYLVIVLASGLATLVHRDRRWVGLGLILAVLHGVSLRHFMSKPASPDFKALAGAWAPQIDHSDLIFVHGRGHLYDWQVAPIYYYLHAERYQYVGRDFARALQRSPHSRVWVLSFPPIPTEKEAIDALAGYAARKRVDARGVVAQLYVGKAAGSLGRDQ